MHPQKVIVACREAFNIEFYAFSRGFCPSFRGGDMGYPDVIVSGATKLPATMMAVPSKEIINGLPASRQCRTRKISETKGIKRHPRPHRMCSRKATTRNHIPANTDTTNPAINKTNAKISIDQVPPFYVSIFASYRLELPCHYAVHIIPYRGYFTNFCARYPRIPTSIRNVFTNEMFISGESFQSGRFFSFSEKSRGNGGVSLEGICH